jgi:hypothetical protein
MADDEGNRELRQRADAALEAALAAALAAGAGIRDPRPYFRPVLKHLRETDPEAFSRAIAHFESELVPALAAGADPVRGWLEYGLLLATALGPGRLLEVDATGRAHPVEAPLTAGGLVLHIPDAEASPVLVLRHPSAGSPPQEATVELLAEGRVTASAYD